jgi:cell shape-determining protein MreC
MVRLINDSASKIEASINTALNTNGIVEGGYGISLKMKFVPRTEVVKVDDQVITSGNEPLVPRGLLLGKVEQVQNQASQGFQDISILPVVDLNKLTIVSVLLTH